MLLRMRFFSVLRGVLPRHRKCVKPLRMSRLWNGLTRRQYGFGKRESDLSVYLAPGWRTPFEVAFPTNSNAVHPYVGGRGARFVL